ncbi:PLU-1-like protein-domain-containing protein [Fimicolochytrium jonesii]|uniref:PLU-1-like protein-domain-containing protein n=1 Tax=Fimicolochytrium jonesii TaxID=1396493 RepID=UPI0022FDD8DE|nr:PLU-1-like protein-domain-containing protein [Fimicolochytrium jonesii]KAI8816843.1 PLU-1-like protein-domain-containing protein [Fimicolochytrium jonesii]
MAGSTARRRATIGNPSGRQADIRRYWRIDSTAFPSAVPNNKQHARRRRAFIYSLYRCPALPQTQNEHTHLSPTKKETHTSPNSPLSRPATPTAEMMKAVPPKGSTPSSPKSAAATTPLHPTTVPKAPLLDISKIPKAPFAPHPTTSPLPERGNRIFGLRPAPVFRPTAEEFKDPMAYVDKIRPLAEGSGICKVVPPVGWKPDFALDTQSFWFRPRIMRLNSMEGSSRAILNYLDQLQKFHTQQGTQFTRVPMLDKKPINLSELKKEVAKRGGYEQVIANKQWAQVGRAIGLGGKTCTSLSHSVKSAYLKWIHPYEEFLLKHRSPAPTRPGSPRGDGEGKGPATRMGTRKKAKEQPVRKAPVVATPPPGSTSPSPKKVTLPQDYLPKPGLELCEMCGGGENDEQMLLCDGCNRGYHLYCFDPPMAAIPQTDWFCPDCLRGSGHDYGFEEGELRSLYHFQQVANDFKKKHFQQRLGLDPEERVVVTEDDVEREFWRLVESPYDDVEVEYGADLHSTQHGSGFPVPEKQPNNPYSTCGWNLNNMPLLSDSLFCNIRNDISGMMIPWLYVGMAFSTFCWHTEDHYTYSINYLHWGETKTWYGIPAAHADGFEATMRKKVPELFDGNPDLLFHLTTMLSPGVLVEEGVDVVAADQRAGEFVITFPRAYHAGFNQGFNFAEAVNFALPNWLPYGLDCVDRYHNYKKQPVFSHDELVIATSMRDIDVKVALWLKPALEKIRDRELKERAAARARHPGIKEVVENVQINREEEDQCAFCHQYCYVSALRCESCNNGKLVCFAHEAELCQCEAPHLALVLRFSDEQLSDFVQRVTQISNKPNEWKDAYRALLASQRRPALKDLQMLLSASEKIPIDMDEAKDLREFIAKAQEWVDKTNKVVQKRKRSNAGRRKSFSTAVAAMTAEDEEAAGGGGGGGGCAQRSLQDVEALVAQIEAMAFDTPEIKLLETLVASVREFQQVARTTLAASNLTQQQLQEVLERGQALDIAGIPEIYQLEQKISELQWLARAESVLDAGLSSVMYEEIIDMIDAGRAFGVKSDHPLIQRLRQAKHGGDEWRVLAAGLMKQRRMDLAELEDVVKRAQDVPVVKELWDQVHALDEKCKGWLKQVRGVTQSAEENNTRHPISLLFSLIYEMEGVPVRLDELHMLREDAKKVSDWTARARKTLRPGSVKSCAEIVAELDANLSACAKPVDQQGEVYCVCRTNHDEGLMVECETCHEWYHAACVKLSKKAAKQQGAYTCPVCDVHALRPVSASARRPTAEQIRQLVAEAEAIERWEMDEVVGMKRVADLSERWKVRAKSVLEDPTADVAALRACLRCAEGMLICVDDEIGMLRERLAAVAPPRIQEANGGGDSPSPVDATEGNVVADPIQMSGETTDVKPATTASEVFCVCREPHRDELGPMIGCDQCSGWFHFGCVGLTAEEAEKIDEYVCPPCRRREAAKAASITTTHGNGKKHQQDVKKEHHHHSSPQPETDKVKIMLKIARPGSAGPSSASPVPMSPAPPPSAEEGLKKAKKKRKEIDSAGPDGAEQNGSAPVVKKRKSKVGSLTGDVPVSGIVKEGGEKEPVVRKHKRKLEDPSAPQSVLPPAEGTTVKPPAKKRKSKVNSDLEGAAGVKPPRKKRPSKVLHPPASAAVPVPDPEIVQQIAQPPPQEQQIEQPVTQFHAQRPQAPLPSASSFINAYGQQGNSTNQYPAPHNGSSSIHQLLSNPLPPPSSILPPPSALANPAYYHNHTYRSSPGSEENYGANGGFRLPPLVSSPHSNNRNQQLHSEQYRDRESQHNNQQQQQQRNEYVPAANVYDSPGGHRYVLDPHGRPLPAPQQLFPSSGSGTSTDAVALPPAPSGGSSSAHAHEPPARKSHYYPQDYAAPAPSSPYPSSTRHTSSPWWNNNQQESHHNRHSSTPDPNPLGLPSIQQLQQHLRQDQLNGQNYHSQHHHHLGYHNHHQQQNMSPLPLPPPPPLPGGYYGHRRSESCSEDEEGEREEGSGFGFGFGN